MRNREYACALITAPARSLAHTQVTKCACLYACIHAWPLVWMRARMHPTQWIHASITHICAYRHAHACTHPDMYKNNMRAYRQENACMHADTQVHIHVRTHIHERSPTRAHA